MRNFIVFIGIFIVSHTYAQQAISLDECRSMALENNKTLKQSRAKYLEAEANKKQARTAYLPKIDGSATASIMPNLDNIEVPAMDIEVNDAGGNATGNVVSFPGITLQTENLKMYSASAAMQIPIYMGGAIRYANKMADKGVEIAQQSYELQTDQVIYNTDEAYWRLAAFKEQLKVASKYYEMLDSLEQQMNDMYELGLSPKSEKLKVTVQKNQAQLNLVRAKNAYKVMMMNLCQIIGLDINSSIEVNAPLNEEPVMLNMQNSVVSAMGKRNELKILDGQVSLSELRKKSISSTYLPQLGAQVSYGYNEIPNLYDGDFTTTAGASLSIPIIHWREKKHKKDVARFQKQQAQYQLDQTRELIEVEVQRSIIQVTEAYESIVLAQKSKGEAIETLDEVSASFDAGLNTTTDVLNAQASWLSANAQLLDALATYEISKTAYYKAIGGLEVSGIQ
ncbi:Outer membrane protein TolC [Saccharicrinis carchari]|uniref:Outer membrane protein TolC n=1 Tax=Saccharicrinis carchari TaxID=1168039 RepID=A0A521BGC0_SACCC|nr:TolC family protein [Saccharicrinis carchari]SMO46089.1 Outer membrane protein TolC [Saccharicrinis carchari]